MTHSYKTTPLATTWRKLAVLGLLGLGWQTAAAQIRYQPAAVQNVAGAYTDLGTSGSVIATTNTDDDNSAATPIGFTFQFNGQSFTDFVLNTNGYLKLGTTAPAAPYYFSSANVQTGGPLNTASETNLILPFNLDLIAGSAGAEYRVAVTGAAPNRICTIQWKNVSDKVRDGIAVQYDNFSFQAKLYETTNRIEFVYNAPTVLAASADAFKLAAVGIKGSAATAGNAIVMQKGSATAWSGAFSVAGNYPLPTGTSVAAHGMRKLVLPDAGRTYRFQPQPDNDASVATIHTLGKLATPNSLPHTVVAAITNNGVNALTNVPVTLTVSGANTFTSTKTIASLASGATQAVTFDAYPTTLATGTNNLTVTVPADGDNSNNSLPYTQQVTTNQVAYVDGTRAFNNVAGVGIDGGILAVKYKNAQTTTVSQVSATFPAIANLNSTYRVVVLDATGANGTPGTVLYTSPVQTRPATSSVVTFTIPQPAPIITGDFFVGLQEVSGNVAVAFQNESPLRANTFYVQASGIPWTTLNNIASLSTARLAIDATFAPVPTCLPPTGVTISNVTATTATVNFTAANTNGTAYTVIYGPRGFNPATGGTTVSGTTSPITITGLTSGTPYDVYVRTACGATETSYLVAPTSFTSVCVPPQIAAFPYAQNFDLASPGTLPCGVTVLNANNDNRTWAVANTDIQGGGPASAPYHLRYVYNETAAADDWFFLPAMTLRAGSTYQLSFKYKAAVNNSAEKLEVKYGTGTTAATQTNLLWQNDNITNTAYTTTTGGTAAGQVLPITPTADGTYYVGFRVYSAANQYNLYVDDITVSTVTGSSAALLRAISLYPNPTQGNLTVKVSGANAKNGLEVEVLNLLGQRVHTTTIRDNMTSQVDLSKLSNGLYLVKVKNGNEYMMRQINVQK
jgi:trimeric autotransporter adhesin